MATERLSNIGYFGLIKEVTPGTPLVPTDFIPLYDENISTMGNFVDITPAYGSRFATYQTLPGQRSYKGDITCMAEANTAARLFDALLTKGTSTNAAGVYTYPYTLTNSTAPATLTCDISLGNIVKRYWGVGISKIGESWNKNEMQFKISLAALGSFEGREIASVSGAGPYTVTLADPNGIFDGNPTKGVVVGDLIRFFSSVNGATVDAVVATVVNGTQITTTTAITNVAGDAVHLRPATPSFNNVQPFLWAKTKVYFGATAAAAFAATQTPVEQGSSWNITHSFKSDDGEDRSGSFSPASLARTTADIDTNIKKICDTPEDLLLFNNLNKNAIVWRHFAGPTNQYELRITLNHVKMDNPLGNLKVGELVYADHKYHENYDVTDGQAFDVKVLNALTTV